MNKLNKSKNNNKSCMFCHNIPGDIARCPAEEAGARAGARGWSGASLALGHLMSDKF